ncbi:MAG: aminoglycoside phosphotransferase family protein [Candidatus Bathyarchaeia archaeon]
MKVDFLLRRIREEFPEIKWKNCRYLTHGWDHIIIILDGKMVFRTPKDSRYKNELKNEIQLLHCLKKKVKVGIPEYNHVSRDRSLAGYNMLMGRELTASRFRRLNASEKEIVAKQLAEFITALHATPKSVIKKFHVKSDNQLKLHKELVRDTKKLLFPRLRKKDVQLIEQYFVELKTALDHNFTNALVHNDLAGEHILWDAKNKQINIIDFSDRAFGDPASDFTGFLEYGLKFTKHVFDLYGGKKDDYMLNRSQLYFKRIPLYVMKDSLQGFPCTFEQGYKMFKKRFKA